MIRSTLSTFTKHTMGRRRVADISGEHCSAVCQRKAEKQKVVRYHFSCFVLDSAFALIEAHPFYNRVGVVKRHVDW